MPIMAQMSFFKLLDSSFPTNKQTIDGRKLRGGYYTPLELAQYLVKWGLRDNPKGILEPSCGDGNFILAILQHLENNPGLSPTITAIELIPDELNKAKDRARKFSRNGTKIDWLCRDFFEARNYDKWQPVIVLKICKLTPLFSKVNFYCVLSPDELPEF